MWLSVDKKVFLSTSIIIVYLIAISPDECQMKSFEKINALLSAIFKSTQV